MTDAEVGFYLDALSLINTERGDAAVGAFAHVSSDTSVLVCKLCRLYGASLFRLIGCDLRRCGSRLRTGFGNRCSTRA
jgi:hypothetical protein